MLGYTIGGRVLGCVGTGEREVSGEDSAGSVLC